MKFTVEILVSQPFNNTFHYLCDDFYHNSELRVQLRLGQLCLVPFGQKKILGCIVAEPKKIVTPPKFQLKSIEILLPFAPLSTQNLQFIKKFADYNMIAWGSVLKMMVSSAILPKGKIRKLKQEKYYQLQMKAEEIEMLPLKMSSLRMRAFTKAENLPPLPLAKLAEASGVSMAVIKKMAMAGIFRVIHKEKNSNLPELPEIHYNPVKFNDSQSLVWQDLENHLKNTEITLLDGETGSGKTALYLQAVAEILQQGKQTLILLPEITLTRQFVIHFQARFRHLPLLWHSSQSDSMRFEIWRAALSGKPYSFIGARSSLLLPFKNLGLIVIDEEHDSSYKQSEGNIYHARDMAILQAKINKIPAILASATPSLESQVNVEKNRYQYVRLHHRYGGVSLPEVRLIDLRKDLPPRGKFLSQPLCEALDKNLLEKKQSILFLNRRGFAPLLLCRACGYRFICRYCDAWLVAHQKFPRLQCHYCGEKEILPKQCPQCTQDDLLPYGPGIERIETEIEELFPHAKVALMSSDTMVDATVTVKLISQMQNFEIDILIGTQILTKGYHFPNLTFVGVVDADLSLAGGDLRAGERTYQLLHQVMGRAGREIAGHVMLQTTHPEHILFQALKNHDREGFYQAEKQIRMYGNWPPYGRMAILLLQAQNQERLHDYARILKKNIPNDVENIFGIKILGPATPPLARLKNKWQIRFLIRTPRNFKLQKFIQDWTEKTKIPSGIGLKIDIDPL